MKNFAEMMKNDYNYNVKSNFNDLFNWTDATEEQIKSAYLLALNVCIERDFSLFKELNMTIQYKQAECYENGNEEGFTVYDGLRALLYKTATKFLAEIGETAELENFKNYDMLLQLTMI